MNRRPTTGPIVPNRKAAMTTAPPEPDPTDPPEEEPLPVDPEPVDPDVPGEEPPPPARPYDEGH